MKRQVEAVRLGDVFDVLFSLVSRRYVEIPVEKLVELLSRIVRVLESRGYVLDYTGEKDLESVVAAKLMYYYERNYVRFREPPSRTRFTVEILRTLDTPGRTVFGKMLYRIVDEVLGNL